MSEDKVIYLSAEGLKNLKEEFDSLKDFKIPEIAARIDEAKQQGDLSENAEYHQAREDMAWAQGRLHELRFTLDRAKEMEGDEKKSGIIGIGATISVKVKGQTKTFLIVGAQEADPLNGKISDESPLGLAFIGRKEGDKVSVKTPSGAQEYEVLEVK